MEDEVCSVCDGTKVGRANWQELNDDQPVDYQPIECTHCDGTGIEPEY